MAQKTDLSIIANRYALAMIDLAERNNLFDRFDADLKTVKATLHECPDLKEFLEHPLIKLQDKKAILESVFRSGVSDYVMNFLKILAERNRFYVFSFIVNEYGELLNKKRKITVAKVITAISIDEHTLNRVKDKLAKTFEKEVQVESVVNPDIIGGMIVEYDDKVIDGSIKAKFEKMKRQVLK